MRGKETKGARRKECDGYDGEWGRTEGAPAEVGRIFELALPGGRNILARIDGIEAHPQSLGFVDEVVLDVLGVELSELKHDFCEEIGQFFAAHAAQFEFIHHRSPVRPHLHPSLAP